MQQQLDQFLDYMEFDIGYSLCTVVGYEKALKEFLRYLKRREVDAFEQVKECHLLGYFSNLQNKPRKRGRLSPSSVNWRIAAIKCLFKFLKREEKITHNIVKEYLVYQKKHVKVRFPIAYNKIERLLESPDTSEFTGAMERAILECVYGCGLRASEACNLRIQDFNFDAKTVYVIGKGNKHRLVPINQSSITALQHYWKMRRSPKETAFAFVKNHQGAPLARVLLYKIVKKHARYCNFQETITPHSLRHAFATHLNERGANIRIIQELLGHSDVSTTGLYLHANLYDLRLKFAKYHPRSVLNKMMKCVKFLKPSTTPYDSKTLRFKVKNFSQCYGLNFSRIFLEAPVKIV